MTAEQLTHRDRIRASLPVAVVHALLAFAFLRGLGFDLPAVQREILQLVDLAPLPPPRPPESIPAVRERSPRAEGAAAPPNLESRRTEIVAPPPVLPPLPPVVVTAPKADTGVDPMAGAAPVPGPGTGSGGQGEGTGSGRWGSGPGGGGGDGDGGGFTPPRRIRGNISDRDYPPAAGAAGIGGTVSVIYTVETDGRATHCAITRSSGSDELDETTCRLIEERFRFRPSRDPFGRPVRSRMVQDHSWETEDEPRTEEPPRRRRGFRLF